MITATNKVDWLLGTGQDRTHMVLVTKDLKTIITSNVSSNTISIIERTSPPQNRPGGPPPPDGPGGPPPDGRWWAATGWARGSSHRMGVVGRRRMGQGARPPGIGAVDRHHGGPVDRREEARAGNNRSSRSDEGPEGFDLSPDTREIWTAHMGDGQVSVIDLASKKVVRTIDAGARSPNRLKFTPDGKRVLISEIFGGGVIVLDTESGSVIKRIKLGRGASGILVPPDGARAYVALTGDNAVAVINLATLTEEARLHTGSGPDGMAWLRKKP